MGAHIDPEFTNLWNMVNSDYGVNYGSANIGSEVVRWGSSNASMIFLGTDGWPKASKLHTFFINLDSANNSSLKVFPNDIFKCRYKGTLSQLGNGAASQTFVDATLQNAVAAAGYVIFELKVTGAKTKDKLTHIKFTVNGHIEDIQIMRPGYVLGDARMVTDECKQWLQGLSVIRLMGQSGCNKNFEREWKYRTPANAPFMNYVENGEVNEIINRNDNVNQNNCYDERANNPYLTNSFNQTRSYPWEKAIDLCNYLDKDFYINLPVLIDLSYAAELSKLLKLRLKPGLKVYIEIGNELWNFGGGGAFHGFGMSLAATHNMVIIQGDKTIDGGFNDIEKDQSSYGNGVYWTATNYTALRRWPAYRMKQYMDEFSKDWGFREQGGVGANIRAVLAGQLAYGSGQDYWYIGNEGSGFLEKAFGAGATNKYIHSIAIAHYTNFVYSYNDTRTRDEIVNMSLDNVFKEFYNCTNRQFGEFGMEGDGVNADGTIGSSGQCEGNELEDILALSKRYGVKVIAYEGGHEANYQGDGGWTPLKNTPAAYNSPKMYEHTLYTMNKWFSWMGHDALFIKNGYYAQKDYGAGYAVAEYEGQQSKQYLAYKKIMETPAPAFSQERGGVIGLNTATTAFPGWKVASYRCDDFRKNSTESSTYYSTGSRRLKGNKNISYDMYMLRNVTSGTYKLSLTFNYVTANSSYDIYFDGKLVKGKWNLSGSFNDVLRNSDTLTLNIPYGVHTLHFEQASESKGSISLQQINIALVKADPLLTVGLTPNPACNPLETAESLAASESEALQLFPNPATNILNVNCTSPISSIAIYHITGSKILTSTFTTAVDVSSLSTGLYLLEATDSHGNRMVKKFEKK